MVKKARLGELESARRERARMEGLIARWCDLTGNVANVLEGETSLGQFEKHLKELEHGK